uniref:B30.2/SPRY domain-containing protein n=1 Tax=Astyanax mexicanus TaxID=7994 RepID=A0A8B9H8M8_ASTMX
MGTRDLQQDSSQPVDELLHRVSKRHKTSLKNKYENLFEGIKAPENRTLLNRIYTQLYIIEGESEEVNKEHEVLQMEQTQRKSLQDSPINCLDIFKPLQAPKEGSEEENFRGLRTVLTKGIAGIGKTVSVQKFILDWAEVKANQDVDFMFVLQFRELNLIKDDQYSLHELLCVFHPELKDLDPKIYDVCKAVFIFDGLDESRTSLEFEECEKVSDVSMTSSVSVLMTNLIKGDLLPSAHIWITSRPAAANQIPPQFINRVTEIQGFTDPQKEEYFRKRISDQDQAQKIISHIKTARSLHIMCHIPVFCWISSTVLQRIMDQDSDTEIPKTLTEMYSHFLLTQINMKKEKYEEKDERDPQKLLESNRTMLLKLAELAFNQLMKGNVMFYEDDLLDSGIDITEASVHSGIFTEIFREECVIYQRKVYCFVHLSFQEFLAALYVLHCYQNQNTKVLQMFKAWCLQWSENVKLEELLCGAVHNAVHSKNGHLDLFLRFLLGISLEANQRILQGLLTPTHTNLEKTIEYINKVIKNYHGLSTDRSINLLLCLFEMNNQSLSREIQEYLKTKKVSQVKLSPGQCTALANMILISEEVLDELDLKQYNTFKKGYSRLVPAVSVCRKALLADSNLTEESCKIISSALQSVNSPLKYLDLSNNDLQDSGVELLSAGLRSSHCKLQTLRLDLCNLNEKTCEILASVLQSVNASLEDLDLSNNDLQDLGVELLSAGLKSSHCKLQILRYNLCKLDTGDYIMYLYYVPFCRLSGCMVTEEGCSSLASALKITPSHLRELDLTYNYPGETGVKLLSDLVLDPHCKLETLRMEHGGKSRMKTGLKKYACYLTLDPNTAHTRLFLYKGNRKVKSVDKDLPYPDHPDRFKFCEQVLSVESLTGRCYWEVEWGGNRADIGVSYRGISRTGGSECWFGNNKLSWSLLCWGDRDFSHYVRHNTSYHCVGSPPLWSRRVGVYLDHPDGALSFYSVSPDTDTLTRFHTFRTTFTEPLYAGLRVYHHLSVCEIE